MQHFTGKSRIVRRRSRRGAYSHKNQKLIRYILIVVAVLGLSYLYVWQRVYCLKLAEERAMRAQQVTSLEDKCRALSYDIAKLSAMRRIESIAVNEFGMTPLKENQVITYPGYRQQRTRSRTEMANSVVKDRGIIRNAAGTGEE
jgi:cell division protein FtsL